jgi:hypothetical protein
VDLGLDLDHEQHAGGGVEGQDVDPARPAAAVDLDFGLDDPSETSQPGRDVGHAAGMHAVALACAIGQEWGIECESDRAAQGRRNPLNLCQAESRWSPALEARNRRLGDAGPSAKLAL